MRRLLAVLAPTVLALTVLTACGSGGTASDRIAETRAKEQATAPGPSAKKADGSAGDQAPEALSSFRCEQGDEDDWTATGNVANDTKVAVSYQVTVYVGPADGTTRKGSTQQVTNVKPGGSTSFEIDGIAADGDQCHVQVLRLAS